MKKVSFRLSDSEYRQIETNRGTKTTSEYLRDTLVSRVANDEKENAPFRELFNDVSRMKDTMNTLLKQVSTQDALIAVTAYLAHAIMMNPAYARYTTELSDLFQQLKVTVKNGGHQ